MDLCILQWAEAFLLNGHVNFLFFRSLALAFQIKSAETKMEYQETMQYITTLPTISYTIDIYAIFSKVKRELLKWIVANENCFSFVDKLQLYLKINFLIWFMKTTNALWKSIGPHTYQKKHTLRENKARCGICLTY